MTVATADILQEGLTFQRCGDFTSAAERYALVLRSDPQNADAQFYLAQILCQQGNVAGGIAITRDALLADSRSGRLHNLLGMALMALDRPLEALASFEQAIVQQPNLASAHGNRGDALVGLGRLAEAVVSYDQALALQPSAIETWCNRGAALQELGRLQDALTCYQRVIELKPDFAEVYVNSGNAHVQLGQLHEAIACYDGALAIRPDYVEALGARGLALRRLGRHAEALESLDRAIAIAPDQVAIQVWRAGALIELAAYDDALRGFDAILARDPRHVEGLAGRGFALNALGRPAGALLSCDQTLAIQPDHVGALGTRGHALAALNRLAEAVVSYDQVLQSDPNRADILSGRGNALYMLNRHDEAITNYDRLLALNPNDADALYNCGISHYSMNRWREAIACHDKALTVNPDHAEAMFGSCMAQLPILYMDESELVERRAAYEARLKALCEAISRRRDLGMLAKAIGIFQPFYLAYQGQIDRTLQGLYGQLACRIMAERYPTPVLAKPPTPGEPVRVGFVSAYLRQHTVWNVVIRGWMSQLDRRRFQLFGYSTAGGRDAVGDLAASMCQRFVDGPLSIEHWREAILADAPHVLIFPELGMDPVSAQLAAQRLAPVQCSSWGHPETSGFPTIDYFLSSDLMEPPDGQEHYTERLVRLPNLSNFYEPLEVPPRPVAREELGLRATATVYWCGQSLFKYLPQFDIVFSRIARAVGDCQFVFIGDQRGSTVTELFRRRIDRAFAAHDLKLEDYCQFLPRVEPRRFVATTGACDVFLDSIGWSGGNTTLEGLTYDLPVVTMAGSLMRGRHSTAFLTMMDVTETIAATVDEYVSIAVRLGRDLPWRFAVKERISANKNRIYRDRSCIAALEEFLIEAVGRGGDMR